MIMAKAGMTRGGFYKHFKSKEALYSIAVESFLMGRGAVWREEAGIDPSNLSPEMAQQMLDSYLSEKHLGDIENQCPMIALPSDVARGTPEIQMAALCVGGMVLARSIPDATLAKEVRTAAYAAASGLNRASGE